MDRLRGKQKAPPALELIRVATLTANWKLCERAHALEIVPKLVSLGKALGRSLAKFRGELIYLTNIFNSTSQINTPQKECPGRCVIRSSGNFLYLHIFSFQELIQQLSCILDGNHGLSCRKIFRLIFWDSEYIDWLPTQQLVSVLNWISEAKV